MQWYQLTQMANIIASPYYIPTWNKAAQDMEWT